MFRVCQICDTVARCCEREGNELKRRRRKGSARRTETWGYLKLSKCRGGDETQVRNVVRDICQIMKTKTVLCDGNLLLVGSV